MPSKNSKKAVLKLLALSVLTGDCSAFTGPLTGIPSPTVVKSNGVLSPSRDSLTKVAMNNKSKYMQASQPPNSGDDSSGDSFDTEFDSYLNDAKSRRDAAYFAAAQGREPPQPPSTMKNDYGPPIVDASLSQGPEVMSTPPPGQGNRNEPWQPPRTPLEDDDNIRIPTREEKQKAMQAAVERQMRYMATQSEDAASQLEAYYAAQGKTVPQPDGTFKDPNEGMTPEEIEERDAQVARDRLKQRMKMEAASGGFVPSSRASDDYLDALKTDAVEKREQFFQKYKPGERYDIEGLEGWVPQTERGLPEIVPPHLRPEIDDPALAAQKKNGPKAGRGTYQQLLSKARKGAQAVAPPAPPVEQIFSPPPSPQPVQQAPPAAPGNEVVPPPAAAAPAYQAPPPTEPEVTESYSTPQDLLSETAQKLSGAMSGALNAEEVQSLKSDLQKVREQLVSETKANLLKVREELVNEAEAQPGAGAASMANNLLEKANVQSQQQSVQPQPEPTYEGPQSQESSDVDLEGFGSMKDYLQELKSQLETQRARQQDAQVELETAVNLAYEEEEETPKIVYPEVDKSIEAVQLRQTNSLLMVHLNDPLGPDDLVRLQDSLQAALDIITKEIEETNTTYNLGSQQNIAVAANDEVAPVNVTPAVPVQQAEPVAVAPPAPVENAPSEAPAETEVKKGSSESAEYVKVKKGSSEGAEYVKLQKAFGLLVKHRGGGPFGLGRLEGQELKEMIISLEEACAILEKETTEAYGGQSENESMQGPDKM